MDNDKVLNDLIKDKSEKTTNTDEIICIVDRSGSMSSISKDAEGGLNSFIEDQKKVGKANLTIVEFDHDINIVCDQININESEVYKLLPRGTTSLLDAIGTIIADHKKYDAKNGKTIIVVLTDGHENSSKEWKRDTIFDLIKERKEAGWEFMFLASGQDAIQVGSSYGFDRSSTVSFSDNAEGVKDAYTVGSVYTSSLRTESKSSALKHKAEFVASKSSTLSETGKIKN